MTTEPDWLNPCEPTDGELMDAFKECIQKQAKAFADLQKATALLEATSAQVTSKLKSRIEYLEGEIDAIGERSNS